MGLVLEYVEHGSLSSLLFDHSPKKELPWSLLYRISTDVTAAMSYVHSMGFIHRDLKGSL